MLGTWRLFLALIVVNGHLNGEWWAATFAVFSFYVISGYLVTMMMNSCYRYTGRGILSFFLNRALRIYPPYYVAVGLSLLVLAVVPASFVHTMNPSLQLPNEFSGALRNLTIFGLTFEQPARLVPPAWALHVELCFYAAIGLVLGRGPAIAAVWLVASAVWTWSIPAARFGSMYFTVAGASLPFAVGACVFHARPLLDRFLAGVPAWLAVAGSLILYWAPFLAAKYWSSSLLRDAFLANIAGTAVLLAVATRVSPPSENARRLDRLLGDLSYPVYLFHWQAGILAGYALGLERDTPAAFVAAAVGALALARMEIRWIAGPLEKLRTTIRNRVPSVGEGA